MKLFLFIPVFFLINTLMVVQLYAELFHEQDSVPKMIVSTGWADEAVTIGYITAPLVVSLMFVSPVVNEWNAGYAGIPASA